MIMNTFFKLKCFALISEITSQTAPNIKPRIIEKSVFSLALLKIILLPKPYIVTCRAARKIKKKAKKTIYYLNFIVPAILFAKLIVSDTVVSAIKVIAKAYLTPSCIVK